MRRFPGSRRHPHFAGLALSRSLAERAVAYVHEPGLGGHRKPRPDSVNTAWRVEAFRGYADHMSSPEFQAALDRLIEQASAARTVILCAEAVPWRCHRQLVADALVARGHAVRHVLGAGQEPEHTLRAEARVDGEGRLTYPTPGTRHLFDDEPGGR